MRSRTPSSQVSRPASQSPWLYPAAGWCCAALLCMVIARLSNDGSTTPSPSSEPNVDHARSHDVHPPPAAPERRRADKMSKTDCRRMIETTTKYQQWEGGTDSMGHPLKEVGRCEWHAGGGEICSDYSYWRSSLNKGGTVEIADFPGTICTDKERCSARVSFCPAVKTVRWHGLQAAEPSRQAIPVTVTSVQYPKRKIRFTGTKAQIREMARKTKQLKKMKVTLELHNYYNLSIAWALAKNQVYKSFLEVGLSEQPVPGRCRRTTNLPTVFLRPQYGRRDQAANIGHWLWDSLWYVFAATGPVREIAKARGVEHCTISSQGDVDVWGSIPEKQPILAPLVAFVLGKNIKFADGEKEHCFPEAYFEPLPGLSSNSGISIGGVVPMPPWQQFLGSHLRLSYQPQPPPRNRKPRLTLLTRRPGGTRVIKNWQKLRDAAEADGWEVLLPLLGNDTHWPNLISSLPSVLEATQRSDAIMAIHGAELSTMHFLRNGTAVIELVSHSYRWHPTVQYWPRHALTADQHHVRWVVPGQSVLFAECLPTDGSPAPEGDPATTKIAASCERTGKDFALFSNGSTPSTRCCQYADGFLSCCGRPENRFGVTVRVLHSYEPPESEFREVLRAVRGLLDPELTWPGARS
eukprot:Hpha_TRINITY_DN4983_c0_g1::TRINITY_DN4983_c0_g1_i1::g.51517::m.51517